MRGGAVVFWTLVGGALGCASSGEEAPVAALDSDGSPADAAVAPDPGPALADTPSGDLALADAPDLAAPDLAEPPEAEAPPPNLPPILADDKATASVGGAPVVVKVLYNDADPDGDMLRVVAVEPPELGEAEPIYGGTQIRYTPPATGASPSDTFEYTADDGHGGQATATVTVNLGGNPTLELTFPGSGEVVEGPMVTVAFDVAGCQFTPPANNSQGCHGHKFLDGEKWLDANGKGFGHYVNSAFQIGPVAPGQHTFTLQLVKNDGTDEPWEPPVNASVEFVVK